MYMPATRPSSEAARGIQPDELGTGEVLSNAFTTGIGSGPTGAAVRAQASQMDQPDIMVGDQVIANPMQPKPLSHDDWLLSDDWRPEQKYEPGMNDLRQKLLAAETDRRDKAAYIDAHWHGAGKGIASTVGGIAGMALDPTMYIPIFGQEAMAARLGTIPAHMIANAAQNALVAGVGGATDALTAGQLQQDPDWVGAAKNVGIAAALGAGMGLITGVVQKIPLGQRLTAAAKALDDDARGEAPDVRSIIQPQEALQNAQNAILDPEAKAPKALDYSTAIPRETPFEVPEGAGDLGIAPEVEEHFNQRYQDLMANEDAAKAFKPMADAADAETKTMGDRAKALMAAALCMGRSAF